MTNNAINTNNQNFLTSVESNSTQRIFRSPLTAINPALGIPSMNSQFFRYDAVFVYVGRTTASVTPKRIAFWQKTGSGSLAANQEVGIFSTPLPPNKTAQTLTKIQSVILTISTTTNNTLIWTNGFVLTTLVPANTHLWAAFRTTSGTIGTIPFLMYDNSQGFVLKCATGSGGTFASSSSYNGLILTAAGSNDQSGIDLRVYLD